MPLLPLVAVSVLSDAASPVAAPVAPYRYIVAVARRVDEKNRREDVNVTMNFGSGVERPNASEPRITGWTISGQSPEDSLPKIRTLFGLLDPSDLGERARAVGYEVYAQKDGGAVLLSSLARVRESSARIVAEANPTLTDGPTPLTLAALPTAVREPLRASLGLSLRREIPMDAVLYGRLDVNLVLNDGSRRIFLRLAGTPDFKEGGRERASDGASAAPSLGTPGSLAERNFMARAWTLGLPLLGMSDGLYGDLVLVSWGDTYRPGRGSNALRSAADAIDRREAEDARLRELLGTELLPGLVARSPLFRSLARAIGGRAGDLPATLAPAMDPLLRDAKSYRFGSREEATVFLAKARLEGVRFIPRFDVPVRGADGSVEWIGRAY